LVKSKINAANKSQKPTNARSLDNLFEKFESITLTSETAPNLRVRKRFGIVHGEATLTGTPHEKPSICWLLAFIGSINFRFYQRFDITSYAHTVMITCRICFAVTHFYIAFYAASHF